MTPTPSLSSGTDALSSLAHGRWLDALVSTVSLVPNIDDVSQIARLPGFLESVENSILLADTDFFWECELRDVFIPLRALLDKILGLGDDQHPEVPRRYLHAMRYEIDLFLTPESMRVLKPKPRGEVKHRVTVSGPSTSSSPSPKKPEKQVSDEELKEQVHSISRTKSNAEANNTMPNTDIVPDKQLDDIAGTAPNINPGFPGAGRTRNCLNCTIATDATFARNPAQALPSLKGQPISALEKQFGGTFKPIADKSAIETTLGELGPGARGIVFGGRGSGVEGHVFNAVVN